MADARIIDVRLDDRTILWRSADIEQERRTAIVDLLEDNHFAPAGLHKDGYDGPYRLALSVADGRLAMAIAREDGVRLHTHLIGLGRFHRLVRDYLAICDSYFQAFRQATPQHVETIDMARRGLHNDGARLLRDRLADVVDIDFDTARRLFTLVCVLHIKA